MKDGAVGLSSGLEYDPGFYATTDELAALASAIKPYGGFYSSHVRDEENECSPRGAKRSRSVAAPAWPSRSRT